VTVRDLASVASASSLDRPQSSGPSVNAGERVTRGKFVIGTQGRGTAGLYVRKTSQPQGRYILTCAHVLGTSAFLSEGQQLADANSVYSPELSRCSDIECNKPIGHVVSDTLEKLRENVVQAKVEINGRAFAVDAALIELAQNAEASNDVPQIGAITGVRDLIQEWGLGPGSGLALNQAQQIAVEKFGATTSHTHGRIGRLKLETVKEPPQNGNDAVVSEALVFEIDAVLGPGEEVLKREYELDMVKFLANLNIDKPSDVAAMFPGPLVTGEIGGPTDAPTLILTGSLFSQPGDSGSPIVDQSRKVVGILRSGTVKEIYVKGEAHPVSVQIGNSQAVFIRAAFEKLQVELMPPGQNTAGPGVATPGMAIRRGPRETADWAAVERMRRDLEATVMGASLARLCRRHYDEVRQLVHHRRRVKVTWHRFKGPGFVNSFLRASRQSGWPLRREIDGVSLPDALRAMRDVLAVEGSAPLRAAVEACAQEILDLATCVSSVEDMTKALRGSALPDGHSVGDQTLPALRIVNSRGVPGTAGVMARDHSGARLLIANHHVIFGGGAATGEVVWALPPDDEGAREPRAAALGTARSGRIGRVSFEGAVYFVDCALIELSDLTRFPDWLRSVLDGPWPAAVAAAHPGAGAIKHGPSTGTTLGTIIDAAYPDRPFIEGRSWTAPGQLLIQSRDPELNFSAPGDSGAALLDEQGRILGLMWGSNSGGQGVACPIEPVLDCLGVALEKSDDVPGVRGRRSA
jgi:hypothetical protein